ncbi:hypothetical protein CO046_04210 [Candidatus Peregrinibacteria bacterium CG_4_9_14_0_2_um_filter_53_11]|nr:MAG: hypothetical protein CO046_04210 [Candidatus Peregrinibacteria bacterium CG_4_9_14_0_2_um_filter_53_11]
MVVINVGPLIHGSQGTRESSPLNVRFSLEEGDPAVVMAPLTGTLELIKLPHELAVIIHDLQTTLSLTCSRCVKSYDWELHIPVLEREFLIDLPKDELDPDEDVFQIDTKTSELHLDDLLREEILLHFPIVSVCSESCKGLCPRCGIDKNTAQCDCTPPSDSPLSGLKELLSNH